MSGMTFKDILEETLPPRTQAIYQKWLSYDMNAVARGQKISRYIDQICGVKDKKVLDIGCGTGGFTIAFANDGANATGIDLNDPEYHNNILKMAQIRSIEEKVNVNFIAADGQRLPFKDDTFDIIICNDVIEHVTSSSLLSKEISRIIKKGGILYISTPNKYSFLEIMSDSHYGLFGIVLLPRRLAEIYVTKIRKISDSYTVSHTLGYYHLNYIFNKNKIKMRMITYSMLVDMFEKSEEHNNHKYINMIIKIIGLKRVMSVLEFFPALAPSFIFIGYKE